MKIVRLRQKVKIILFFKSAITRVRVYSESFEENLIFLFWYNSAHKALGRTHLINGPIAIVLDNGLAPCLHGKYADIKVQVCLQFSLFHFTYS